MVQALCGFWLVGGPGAGELSWGEVVAVGAAGGYETAVNRIGCWTAAARLWAKEPLVGVGVGRMRAFYPSVRSPASVIEGSRDATADSAPACVFDLVATAGTPALLVYLGVLVLVGRILWERWEEVRLDGPSAGRARIAALVGLLAAHGT